MRKIFALLIMIAVLSCPGISHAASNQCAIDKTVDGYARCPFGDTNDFLISQGYIAARLDADVRLSQTPIYAHDLCRYTDARGLDTDPAIFIPFATQAEYQSFINGPPAHIDVVECCLPRNLMVKDVPEPGDNCFDNLGGAGHWILQSLVDPHDTTVVIARPQSTDPDALLILVNAAENSDYPIQALPIQRDNIDAVLPKGSKVSDYYVGRFLCSFGKKPVSFDPSDSVGVAPVLAPTQKTIGAVVDVPFRLICRDATWTPIPPDYCEPGQVGSTYEDSCPNNQAGVITKRIVHTCPNRTLEVQTISNTCMDCASKPRELVGTTTKACPAGKVGTVTVRTYRTYYLNGTQCAHRDQDEEDDSGCHVPTCPGDEAQGDETDACPVGQVGSIVYGVVKHYTLNQTSLQCEFTLVKTLKRNTCTGCPADQAQNDEAHACPAGQSGQIIYSVVKHYTVNTGANQCDASLIKTLRSNTCADCASKPDVKVNEYKQACSGSQAGYAGYDVIGVFVHYSLSGTQCVTSQYMTKEWSNCTACAGSVALADETLACPVGQTGSIVIGHTRVSSVNTTTYACESTIQTYTKSNTCTSPYVPPYVPPYNGGGNYGSGNGGHGGGGGGDGGGW